MFVAFCVGVSLWPVYGFMKGEAAAVVTGAVTIALGAATVWMRPKFKLRAAPLTPPLHTRPLS